MILKFSDSEFKLWYSTNFFQIFFRRGKLVKKKSKGQIGHAVKEKKNQKGGNEVPNSAPQKSLVLLSGVRTMATLSFSFLNSISSSFSSSSSSTNHFLPQPSLTKQELPTLSRYNSKRRKLLYQPTRLILHPVLLLSGFDKPLDTQTFLATISVLAAIALSLVLGLKVIPPPFFQIPFDFYALNMLIFRWIKVAIFF